MQESIEELRYYREAVFVPPPGPDSATAKGIAAKHQGALTGAVVAADQWPLPARLVPSPRPRPLDSTLRAGRTRPDAAWWV